MSLGIELLLLGLGTLPLVLALLLELRFFLLLRVLQLLLELGLLPRLLGLPLLLGLALLVCLALLLLEHVVELLLLLRRGNRGRRRRRGRGNGGHLLGRLFFPGLLLGRGWRGRWGWGGGGRGGLGRLLLGRLGLGLLGLRLELLGCARTLAQLGVVAGAHQIDGDRLRLGHTQLPLRLDGEERPSQDRCVQQDGGDQSAPHCRSLGYDPSDSVTSETLVKPADLTRPITRITVP